jgi:hypothetical protein
MKSYQAAALSLIVMVSIVVLGAIAVFSFTVFFGTREVLIPRGGISGHAADFCGS